MSRSDESLLVLPTDFRLELKSLLGQMFKNILQDVNADKSFYNVDVNSLQKFNKSSFEMSLSDG